MRALGLVCLFTFVMLAATQATTFLTSTGSVESVATSTTTTEQAAGGAGLSILTVIEASVLLGILAIYRKTPEWLRPVLKRTIATAFWIAVGLAAALAVGLNAGFTLAVLGYFGIQLADALGVYWLLNDCFAVVLAVAFGASAGIIAGPVVLGVALVGLSVYDHVFANRRDWMFTLARGTVRWKVPSLVVVPTTWRLPWADLAAFTTDEDDSPIGFAVGMADLALPAAFVTALFAHDTWFTAWGASAGVMLACLHLSWVIGHTDGGAGLPPLTAGALGGWAIAAGVGVVV